MSHELTEMGVLVSVLARALVAKGVLSKEDLLAELSRVQKIVPQPALADLQQLILNLPSQ